MNVVNTRRPARPLAHRLLDQAAVWFSGAMLSAALLMIAGLFGFILVCGLGAFWPAPLWRVTLKEGSAYLGLVHSTESIPHAGASEDHAATRTLLRLGNRDLNGSDFIWITDAQIASRAKPADAVYIDRLEWGPFCGFVQQIIGPGGVPRHQPSDQLWSALQRELAAAHRRYRAMQRLQRNVIGDLNTDMDAHRLALKRLEYLHRLSSPKGVAEAGTHHEAMAGLEQRYNRLLDELRRQRQDDASYRVVLADIEGRTKELPLSAIVRVYRPNQLTWIERVGVYLDRLREFLFEEPREANSEGGVAPAIFGTVMMTLLMSVVVVPLGVLAALYLHEYAKQGVVVSLVRIAVNNLAGVPSIVFGVFGLGFFCYALGGTIDRLWFPERLPTPTFGGGAILWASLTLALLTMPVVIVATEEALAAVPDGLRAASLACGATKFQTIWRIVLPSALPGIITGTILAMARGAGEVAPLMITGVVKLAPNLPIDRVSPFFHLERKFMHLGFHIYDVGFQSPNVEASKPMVYMTALLLLAIIICLNVAAMRIRGQLYERFRGGEV